MNQILDTFDSGSNYKFSDKTQYGNVPRSLFDLSHLNTTTIENCGKLLPIALFETVPGDSFDLSVEALVRVLPQVVPPYSRQRLYIHAAYSRITDLWDKAQTFMTKGYSGNNILSFPTLNANNLPASLTVQPESVYDMMGIPIGTTRQQIIDAKINALPFMMYTRFYRDYMMNKNFYIADRTWLPDDDHDFMLDSDGKIKSNPTNLASGPQIGKIYYRDYPQDYFLSSLPFPQRGDTPALDFNLTTDSFPVGLNADSQFKQLYASGYFGSADPSLFSTLKGASGLGTVFANGDTFASGSFHTNITGTPTASASLSTNPLLGKVDDVLAQSTITLNQLRELASQQTILEKMARTDGSYAQFGMTFFGRTSKNAFDYRPTYIGGTYQSIAFTEVLQTTPTTTSPLGTYGGHGIAYTNNGYIGKCDCDDYGYIMLFASIMPDVYYSQGLDRTLTRSLQSDMYLPERSRLGLREVLNKELYFSGDVVQDNDLFAYQNPYDEFRYKPSAIHGKIADPTELSFYPYTQARRFSSLPTYSQSLAVADNVRKDYLAAPTEVAYTGQFSIKCRAVRPLPYNPIPLQMFN